MPSVKFTAGTMALGLLAGLLMASPAPATQDAEGASAITGVAEVSPGAEFTCIQLDTGKVRCWGTNVQGELGRGDLTPHPFSVGFVRNATDTADLSNVVQVAAGDNHACALLTSQEVRCWGSNADRQLGNGGVGAQSSLPIAVLSANGTGHLDGVIAITAESDGACALLSSRQVRCWGDDDFGQLGDGSPRADRGRPVVVRGVGGTGALGDVTQIESGWDNTCARLRTGQARCWGYNNTGALGNGSTASSTVPVVVKNVTGAPGPLTEVTQISAGGYVTCARLSSGQARCWGRNDRGELGNGTTTASRRPRPVRNPAGTGPLTGVAQITVGESHACARVAGGEVRCWGSTLRGQVGDDTLNAGNRLLPVAVKAALGTGNLVSVIRVRTHSSHTCVRTVNGQAQCWGRNERNQASAYHIGDLDRPVVIAG